MKRLLRTLVWLLLAGGAVAAFAREPQLEIIPLQHRLVRDVLPLLQPLLAPEGTLTGEGSQLIVRTTPENLATLKTALSALDVAPIRLRVTVSQSRRDDRAGGGRVQFETTGNAAAPDGQALPPDHYSTRTTDGLQLLQTVLTMDGQPALIELGQTSAQPVILGYVVTPSGPGVSLGVDQQTTRSGFYLTPSLHGETVEIALAARLASADDQAQSGQRHQQSQTTVRGRLGEWIAAGGSLSTGASGRHDGFGGGPDDGSSDYQLWVRVERAP